MFRLHHTHRLASLLSVTLFSGCVSKASLFPDDMPTMRETYDTHHVRTGLTEAKASPVHGARRVGTNDVFSTAPAPGWHYTRDAHERLSQRFPTVPNPTLLMYVDPHLTVDGLPVPGYTTAFTLYDRVHYALPGEVPGAFSPQPNFRAAAW